MLQDVFSRYLSVFSSHRTLPASLASVLTELVSLVFSGWSFLAPSTTWRLKCSPAPLPSRCFPVQPRSGRWRRSWRPRAAWQRVRLWARCWRIDACRPASPGWCTGRFPGRTALTPWVHTALTADFVFFFFFPLQVITCFMFIFLFYLFHRFSLSGQQWKREESPSVSPEGNTSIPEFRCHLSHLLFCKKVLCIPYSLLFCQFWLYWYKVSSSYSEWQYKENQNERWKWGCFVSCG